MRKQLRTIQLIVLYPLLNVCWFPLAEDRRQVCLSSLKCVVSRYTCLIFIRTEIIAKNQLPNTKQLSFEDLPTYNGIVLISKSNYVQTIESSMIVEWHLIYADFFFLCSPSRSHYYGQFRSRISLKRFMTRFESACQHDCISYLSLKLPKMLVWKFWPFMWLAFVDSDSGPPTSIGESDLDGAGLAVEFWSLLKGTVEASSEWRLIWNFYLEPGEGLPSLLPEHDWWLILFDSGRSFSDSIRGLDGATLELLQSSSSKSTSPVTFGEDESRLSPSCWWNSRRNLGN